MNPISNNSFNYFLFRNNDSLQKLKKQRSDFLPINHSTQILISGSGPAGLIRAIEAAAQGYSVRLLEMRSESSSGRENTVDLDSAAIYTLNAYGIIDFLTKNSLIFPSSQVVRLQDLEYALKTTLAELTGELLISYDTTITKVEASASGTQVIVKSGNKEKVHQPNILVVVEGGKSTTNSMLGVGRQNFLEKIPVIAAIFEDKRPKNPKSLKLKAARFSLTFYYHLLFCVNVIQFISAACFNSAFRMPKNLTGNLKINPKSKIAGAIPLATPGQNYCGIALNKQETERLSLLDKKIKELKIAGEFKSAAKVERTFNKKLKKYAYFGFTAFKLFAPIKLTFLPFKRAQWIHIGADKADVAAGIKGNMTFLLAGDSLATVDPSTGRGCSTAISSVHDFSDFLLTRDLEKYKKKCDLQTKLNHEESQRCRQSYRPDLVA